MMRHESRKSAVALLLVLLATLLVWQLVQTRATRQIADHLGQRAALSARAIESEIERFGYLPAVAAEDVRIRDLLAAPGDPVRVDAAKAYLETVATASGAAFLFLMDDSGLTLAASNWRSEEDLTGNNYAFRPYFQEAIARGEGRYYAIGVTTGRPGYFLARRVEAGPHARGVMVVKIDLRPLEQAWVDAGAEVSIADRDGIVFLSGRQDWKYRAVRTLDDQTLARLTRARAYDGIDLRTGTPIITGPAEGEVQARQVITLDDGALAIVRPLPREGWNLYASASLAPATREATTWAAVTALLGLLLTGALRFALQRRQLIALRLSQHETLERRVHERTLELAREVEVRRGAEAELRKAQDGLVHAEKMAALGRMSAAIAHEVSQPLAALETTLASAQRVATDQGDDGNSARLATARALVRRMQRTVRHLRTFARRDSAERERLDCRACVVEALALAQPRARAAGIEPELSGEGDFVVHGTALRLEQVFLNLVLNALDAVEGRRDGWVRVTLTREVGRVAVAVVDNGAGIAAGDLAQVTEPFFSRKTRGEGLGLGLSISAAIVEEHGGEIRIESVSGEGTRAVVLLPLALQDEAVVP